MQSETLPSAVENADFFISFDPKVARMNKRELLQLTGIGESELSEISDMLSCDGMQDKRNFPSHARFWNFFDALEIKIVLLLLGGELDFLKATSAAEDIVESIADDLDCSSRFLFDDRGMQVQHATLTRGLIIFALELCGIVSRDAIAYSSTILHVTLDLCAQAELLYKSIEENDFQ